MIVPRRTRRGRLACNVYKLGWGKAVCQALRARHTHGVCLRPSPPTPRHCPPCIAPRRPPHSPARRPPPRSKDKVMSGSEIIGNRVRVKVVKNKVRGGGVRSRGEGCCAAGRGGGGREGTFGLTLGIQTANLKRPRAVSRHPLPLDRKRPLLSLKTPKRSHPHPDRWRRRLRWPSLT